MYAFSIKSGENEENFLNLKTKERKKKLKETLPCTVENAIFTYSITRIYIDCFVFFSSKYTGGRPTFYYTNSTVSVRLL